MRAGATQFTGVLICLPTQDKQIPSEQKVSHGTNDHVRLDAKRTTGRDQKTFGNNLVVSCVRWQKVERLLWCDVSVAWRTPFAKLEPKPM